MKVQLVEETALFGEQALTQVVATLRNPVLAGDTLTYEVRVLQGEMPAKGGLVSVFSYAGAARRRAYYLSLAIRTNARAGAACRMAPRSRSGPGILGPSCARTISPDISAS